MSVNREGMEKLADRPCKCDRCGESFSHRMDYHYAPGENEHCPGELIPIERRALISEAREEGKPLEKSEGQKATEWSQRPTREWEPPASAGTEGPGPIERVARALARAYWQGRGETITKEQEDEFWLSWGRDAEAALPVEGEK